LVFFYTVGDRPKARKRQGDRNPPTGSERGLFGLAEFPPALLSGDGAVYTTTTPREEIGLELVARKTGLQIHVQACGMGGTPPGEQGKIAFESTPPSVSSQRLRTR
jgi:hypothetical protein